MSSSSSSHSSSESSSSSTIKYTSSSSSSTTSSVQAEINAINYRFEGYQLPKIQLDSTGPSYVVLPPHPYLRNQPTYWQHNAFRGIMPLKSEVIGGEIRMSSSAVSQPSLPQNINTQSSGQTGGSGISQMLPF